MGDFREKYPADWLWGKKILQGIPGKKNSYTENIMCNVGNKILHCCMSGKKILSPEVGKKINSYPNQINHTHPRPPTPLQKSNGRPMTTSHWKTKLQAKFFKKRHWHNINGYANTAAKRLLMCQVEHFQSLFQSHFPVRSGLPRALGFILCAACGSVCSASCCSCFWLFCSYWNNCFYG